MTAIESPMSNIVVATTVVYVAVVAAIVATTVCVDVVAIVWCL